ncbi:hypothetical protein MNODULE_01715 [Nitrospiraceae bacterium HYJII51-Mn-bac16s-1-B09]|uniref:Transcriptional regulator n=1 Tax=Candidatus Manganitrophus noduliformans TaxID=2606439 RepID=A0A7X6DM69_9BACT|nr:hypothetical protein [Candidatus Manganitrophus noduliformans]
MKQFIAERIDSVELLEVLLFLRANSEREWRADEVSKEFRSSTVSISKRLADLHARELLFLNEGSPPRYRYNPRTNKLVVAVDRLAEAYALSRARVIDLIFSKPADKLRHFSDAFKLRKEEEDD